MSETNAYYDDGNTRFGLRLDADEIKRLSIVHYRGTSYNLVVEDTKTKVQQVISSDFIYLVN